MSGSDLFNTKTNNQTEPVGFLINQSNPTDGDDLNRTQRFSSVRSVKPLFFYFKSDIENFKMMKPHPLHLFQCLVQT